MATKLNETSAVNRALLEEEAKRIVMRHFRSFYVDRSLTEVFRFVSPAVRWIGSREHYVAHNKEEYMKLMREELKNIPQGCSMDIMMVESTMLHEECFSVSGEFEVRIPHPDRILYFRMSFSIMLNRTQIGFSIVSVHTAVADDVQVFNPEEDINGRAEICSAEEMREQQKELYDTLTGLYNLEAFKEKVRQLLDINPKEKYVLFCTDVTHFERVNNLYGMARADRMLLAMANMLPRFSEGSRLCCRSMADHFLVLQCYEDENQLRRELDCLCLDFRKMAKEEYPDAAPRLGLGIYRITDYEEDVDRMVENVNVARKALKMNQGSSLLFYDPKVFQKVEKVKEIENSMQDAMDKEEFRVFIQPKYDLKNDRISGAEALCRWVKLDGSMVYPDEFIPVFEEDGFIADLDYYMLEKVCQMIMRRIEEGRNCVCISINQSRVLLKDKEYVKKIEAILKRYQIPSEFIELELTERIFQDDLSEFAQTMSELKEMGIRWSIDDFGTGYSSLNLLKELPVDIIKIDKSFLDESETSKASRVIIRKTVELTRELDKHVVCEGVETESQAEYLRDICCDMAQGYLYARPMPMEDFEELLDKEINR